MNYSNAVNDPNRHKRIEELLKMVDDALEITSNYEIRTKLYNLKNEIRSRNWAGDNISDIYNYVIDSLNNLNINIAGEGFNPNEKPETSNGYSNPYGFTYDEIEETELIKKYAEEDIPVFIHGLSGAGKSQRVKQIDPDCTIIYLASAKPETVSGKSAVINGEVKDLPPAWYTQLCEKCEKEPNKIHILFFDEITNATPSIQGLAYNIILNKEVDGKWKLPKNCRIVAAGNEMEESLAASPIPEPLFRRFAHVYVKTTVVEWVLWASENNIHPAIIAFVVSNGYDADTNPVFRTKCNGKDPCVDPRKWEMASKALRESNNPNILVGILGKDITKKFIAFVRGEFISLDQVLQGQYDKSNDKIEPDKACRVIYALCGVDADHVKEVIEFIDLKLLPEHYELFKKIWTAGGKDKKRVNILQEIELKKKMSANNNSFEHSNNDSSDYSNLDFGQRRVA